MLVSATNRSSELQTANGREVNRRGERNREGERGKSKGREVKRRGER